MKSPKQAGLAAIEGRLRSRPSQPSQAGSRGLQPLRLDGERDGFLYVPKGYVAERPAPMILMLHGARGDAEGAMSILRELADPFNTILLAVDSRRQTWDIIMSQYGPDIAFIDLALAQTFSRYAIDKNRIAIAGFSDGASYALSVAITNGDLFTHAIAFSPGFIAPADQIGSPRLFISHGKRDNVLRIEQCSRRIVPRLQQAGYELLYQEFDGPHTVPEEITLKALDWFTTPVT
ncbi:MAG TPA: phospholipase [Cyanobacteria bacterium UBA8803]|nr:phospholipase [Cyanobacteria bacterium UBA9273]HBL62796.1 phospholipase [Cyanobacteria bacterium UBA8803]